MGNQGLVERRAKKSLGRNGSGIHQCQSILCYYISKDWHACLRSIFPLSPLLLIISNGFIYSFVAAAILLLRGFLSDDDTRLSGKWVAQIHLWKLPTMFQEDVLLCDTHVSASVVCCSLFHDFFRESCVEISQHLHSVLEQSFFGMLIRI